VVIYCAQITMHVGYCNCNSHWE